LPRNHGTPGCARANEHDTLRDNGPDSGRYSIACPPNRRRCLILPIRQIPISRSRAPDQGPLWGYGSSDSSRTRPRHTSFFGRSHNCRRLVLDPNRARAFTTSWDIFRGFNDNTIRLFDRRRSSGLVVAAKAPYRYFEPDESVRLTISFFGAVFLVLFVEPSSPTHRTIGRRFL
jgi:hypothetical protein